MKFAAGIRVGLVLLFMVMQPLRGFASAPSCASFADTASSAMEGMHHAMGAMTHSHHVHANSCGECCCMAAVDVAAMRWEPPQPIVAEPADAPLPIPLAVLPDGLERPPRR